MYNVSSHQNVRKGSLIESRANGSILGEDVRLISKTGRQMDVQGIDNHLIVDLPVWTIAGAIPTQWGDVIVIVHQHALAGKGKTINSAEQLEWNKPDVNNKSIKFGGLQCMKTFDGYMIP